MKNIIQTSLPGKHNNLQWVFCALLGFAFIFLVNAFPALMARAIMLPGDSVRDALLEHKGVTETDLKTLAISRERTLKWRPMAAAFDDLALVFLTLAGAEAQEGGRKKELMGKAIYWQRQSLARAPANTFGWARLAYMILQVQGITDEVESALMRSIETGPYEPSMMIIRLNMIMHMLDRIDEDLKKSIPFMIVAAFNYDLEGLAKAARQNNYVDAVYKVLSDYPEKKSDFRDMIGNLEEAEKDNAAQKENK